MTRLTPATLSVQMCPLPEDAWVMDPYTDEVPDEPCGHLNIQPIDDTEAYLRLAIELRRRGMHKLVRAIGPFLSDFSFMQDGVTAGAKMQLIGFVGTVFELIRTSKNPALVTQVLIPHGDSKYRVIVMRGVVYSISRIPPATS